MSTTSHSQAQTSFFGARPPVQPRPAPKVPVVAPAAPQMAPAPSLEPVRRTATLVSGAPDLDEMLEWIAQQEASDLHLSPARTPHASLHGELVEVPGYRELTEDHIQSMVRPLMSARHTEKFDATKDVDLAYSLEGVARYRVNVAQSLGRMLSVMRFIPPRVKTADELDLPEVLRNLTVLPQGLVLVTGPTGSGKSTLNAALIDLINASRRAKIITIEDPVEFVHTPSMSDIVHREVGEDTESFGTGLRASLRQAPDVILLGEMRDLETTRAAINAAETGHLVFATMHTKSAAETISRAVNQFPGDEQNQIQSTLATTLAAVITQTLVPLARGGGRAAAREVMVANRAVRAQVREGKLEQIDSTLQAGGAEGMHTLGTDLARLVSSQQVTEVAALRAATQPEELRSRLGSRKVA